MTQTKNLGLNKPDGTDFYDVGDFNTNADIIDRAIGDMSKELEGKADTDHTHTPGSIGAATSDQGAKADSAVQTIKINGVVQTKSAGVVNLPAYPAKLPADGGNADTVDGKHAADFAAANHTHSYAAASHNHDTRYYTEAEVNNLLAGKAASVHNHTAAQISGLPASLPANGGNADTVDGVHVVTSAALGLHRLASGTAAATTANCPAGAWYGQHS